MMMMMMMMWIVQFIGTLPPSKRTIDTFLSCSASHQACMLPQICFLHYLHVQQCAFVCILILHSWLSQLILVPPVMLPKNVKVITLPSRCYSPFLPFYTGNELIRKTFTQWLQSLSTENCLYYMVGISFSFACFITIHTITFPDSSDDPQQMSGALFQWKEHFSGGEATIHPSCCSSVKQDMRPLSSD